MENVQRTSDQGTYSCTARNKQNYTAQRSVDIRVLGKFSRNYWTYDDDYDDYDDYDDDYDNDDDDDDDNDVDEIRSIGWGKYDKTSKSLQQNIFSTWYQTVELQFFYV